MKNINIHEAKTNLSSILKLVSQGKKFLICKNGKPIADLVPHEHRKRTESHPVMSKITINYDPLEELSSEEWGEIN